MIFHDARPDGPTQEISDDELLGRAVFHARCQPGQQGRGTTRLERVMSTFMLGSTFAAQLLVRFGLDPDERP
jgi:hypothetical protein